MLSHLVLSRELDIRAFSSLLWLWDAQAKHGFVSCGVHALLPLLRLLMLEMQTRLCGGSQGHHGIPPAYVLSLGKGGLPSPGAISAAFTLCSPHPQPLAVACLPACSSAGGKGCEGSGVKCCRETHSGRRAAPLPSMALLRQRGILGAVVPARAAVIQRLSCPQPRGLVEARCTCMALRRLACFHSLLLLLLPHLLLPLQWHYLSLLHLLLPTWWIYLAVCQWLQICPLIYAE